RGSGMLAAGTGSEAFLEAAMMKARIARARTAGIAAGTTGIAARTLALAAGGPVAVVAAGVALGGLAGHAGAQEVEFELIALTGDPAPGLVDVAFGRLSSPRLNDHGARILVSELAGAAVTEEDNGALW